MLVHLLALLLVAAMMPPRALGQDVSSDTQRDGAAVDAPQVTADKAHGDEDKRIFGIIPNYRTSPTLTNYTPLAPAAKFHLATDDAFDRGTFILAAHFAILGQWKQSAPSFGNGVSAFGRYYATALGDLVIGDVMTEAISQWPFIRILGIFDAAREAPGAGSVMQSDKSSGHTRTRAVPSSTSPKCSVTPPPSVSRMRITPTTARSRKMPRVGVCKSASTWPPTS